MPRSSPEPIDLPDELPELDDDPESADDAPGEDPEAVLVPLGDELDTDRDDEIAGDLDIGIDLSMALDGGGDANDELVLDIGELLDDARERNLDEDGGNEPLAPDHFDASVGIHPLPEQTPDGDDEAPPDSAEIAGELPALDADEPGDFGAEPNWPEIDSLAASDHPLRDAGRRWHTRLVSGVDRPCRDLAPAHGDVLVAGVGLWRTQGDSAELLFTDDKSLESIAVTMGSVVYVNAAGSMRRLVLDAGASSASSATTLDDAVTSTVATVHDGERIIAISGLGSAYESADGGRSWTRLAVPGRVLAVPRRAERLMVLVDQNGHRKLVVEELRGTLVDRLLDPTALLVAGGDAPQIDALGHVILLFHPGRGLVVSSDGGHSFTPIPGSAGTSAVCLGRWDREIRAWAALHSEWTGKTDIALINPEQATAERIAELSLADPSDEAEAFPASALYWDAGSARLWVGGAHGLMLLEPDDVEDVPKVASD